MKGFVFGVVVLLLLSCEGAMGAANFTLAFYEGGTCEDYTFTVLPQEVIFLFFFFFFFSFFFSFSFSFFFFPISFPFPFLSLNSPPKKSSISFSFSFSFLELLLHRPNNLLHRRTNFFPQQIICRFQVGWSPKNIFKCKCLY